MRRLQDSVLSLDRFIKTWRFLWWHGCIIKPFTTHCDRVYLILLFLPMMKIGGKVLGNELPALESKTLGIL